jgi:hypothetical protein
VYVLLLCVCVCVLSALLPCCGWLTYFLATPLQALLKQDMVGIARLVKRANDGPQLGAVLPSPVEGETALVRAAVADCTIPAETTANGFRPSSHPLQSRCE